MAIKDVFPERSGDEIDDADNSVRFEYPVRSHSKHPDDLDSDEELAAETPAGVYTTGNVTVATTQNINTNNPGRGATPGIHKKTEFESRIESLEQKMTTIEKPPTERKYEANQSFQDAVKDSLTQENVLSDTDVADLIEDEISSWDYFDEYTKKNIQAISIEPVHDIVVLLGVVMSVIGIIITLLLELHVFSISFVIMSVFLVYSYRRGLGQ